VKILVAVADVDSIVKNGSAIDAHARHNTTSVYTAATVFPMLPEELSTNLTSLNPNEDRTATVVEMVIGKDDPCRPRISTGARVRNHAKLAYNSVAAWLEGNGAMPEAVAAVKGLDDNLRVQNRVAQKHEEPQTRTWGPQPRNRRSQTGIRRQRNPRSRSGEKEPGQGHH